MKRALVLAVTLLFVAVGPIRAQSPDAELVAAARNRDASAVDALLPSVGDLNATDAETMTALHWAAHWNDIEMVRRLVDAGADVNVSNRYGVTPLHEASTLGNVPMLEVLLEAGADPNAGYGSGETPVMSAARTGVVEAVRLLLDYGGNPNAAEEWRGQTALMWAAVEDHAEVAQLLIDRGARINVRSTLFEFGELSQGAGGAIVDRPTGGLTPLIFAARSNAIDVAGVLLRAGADLDIQEPQYGFTAMQAALVNGHWDLAAFLIENGADVNDGSLYSAIETRNTPANTNRPAPRRSGELFTSVEVIEMLLRGGANPNLVYTKGYPPRQAQGEVRVPPGSTPLLRAVRSMDTHAIELLMKYGADPSLALNDGSTPLMAMAGQGARGAFDEDLRLEMIRLFWNAGLDVDATHAGTGNTALHFAAERGAARIVDFLVAAGADLHAENDRGQTPANLLQERR